MRCASCGSDVKEAKFCSSCGSPLLNTEVVESGENTIYSSDVLENIRDGTLGAEVSEAVSEYNSDAAERIEPNDFGINVDEGAHYSSDTVDSFSQNAVDSGVFPINTSFDNGAFNTDKVAVDNVANAYSDVSANMQGNNMSSDVTDTANNVINTVPAGADFNRQITDNRYEYKSKITAGLLGIFFGGLGVHNFYLGYSTKGLIQLIVTIVSFLLACCGGISLIVTVGIGIWGFIEGILILAGVINRDGKGMPFREDVKL